MQTSIRPYCFQKCKCQISVLRFIYMTVHSSSDLSGGKINEQILFSCFTVMFPRFSVIKKSEMTYDTKIAFVRQILLTHYMTFWIKNIPFTWGVVTLLALQRGGTRDVFASEFLQDFWCLPVVLVRYEVHTTDEDYDNRSCLCTG